MQAGRSATPGPVLGGLALMILVPVTLPVPVLRELVQERFGVSELLTSAFMSINMVGAVLAAPLAGALADRFGHRPRWILGALLLDALCFVALTLPVPFALFMAVRFLEGCAHITALSHLLAVAAASQAEGQRGRVMGLTGGGLLLGVALGAPLGGVLGSRGPLVPLYAGAALLVVAAALAALFLVDREGQRARPSLAALVQTLRGNAVLAVPLVFAFMDRFTVGFYTTTFSLYLRRIHALEPLQIGLLIATFMFPFALLSYPFGRLSERVSLAALMCGGSVIYGLGTASLAFWPADALGPLPPPGALWLLMGGLGVAAAVMFVPSLLMTTQLAPDAVRSTALGAFNGAGSLGFIIGPVTGGLVAQVVAETRGWEAGYQAAFGVAGASEILCALIALPFLLRLRRAGRTT